MLISNQRTYVQGKVRTAQSNYMIDKVLTNLHMCRLQIWRLNIKCPQLHNREFVACNQLGKDRVGKYRYNSAGAGACYEDIKLDVDQYDHKDTNAPSSNHPLMCYRMHGLHGGINYRVGVLNWLTATKKKIVGVTLSGLYYELLFRSNVSQLFTTSVL